MTIQQRAVANEESVKQPSTLGAKCCVACGSSRRSVFFSIPRLPVNVGYAAPAESAAREADFGAVELAYCYDCTHIYNSAFEADRVQYQPGYEVALNHSPIFRRFMEGVADRLLKQHDLNGKAIIEIGSGRGWFLSRLCEWGDNRGLGIDPSTLVEGKLLTQRGHVELQRGYFADDFEQRFRDWNPDFVCCLSVFEHVPQPLEFLQRLRRFIGPRKVGLYWEVFNSERAFREREIWSVLYEQCNYFSLQSLTSIMRRAGFQVLEAGGCYEADQYLYVDAVSTDVDGLQTTAAGDGQDLPLDLPTELPDECRQFVEHFRSKLQWWQAELDAFRKRQARVVFWGSGGKGVSFLNLLDTRDLISYVVEINPDKQGRFIPGTGQRIVPPEFLRQYSPDVIIISNALYRREIAEQASSLGVDCAIYVA